MFEVVDPKLNFPKLEEDLLKMWYKEGIVKKYLQKNNSSKKKFSFLDGPITANNPMGVHHAWGRTYKDLWQRFWNMRGYKQRFQNGFDEQGLWVEVEVEKELGLKNKKDIENLIPGNKFASLEKFINLCKERVRKFSKIQTEQSKRLGYFMDWDNSYHTSSDRNNYTIWNFLKIVNEKGWLYKGRDSVPWCPRCGTAISQHEILTEEYKELTHKTVVFKLTIKGRNKEYLLAWTTTPWTIPGNVALAVDNNLSYWKMENAKGEKIIIVNPTANGDLNKEAMLVNRLGLIEGYVKVEELKGKDLVGLGYEAPYDSLPSVKKTLGNYTHRVVATDPQVLPINPAEGTGIVHIAPGAGAEDFKLSKKEKIPAIEEIDESGVFIDGFDFMSGKHVKKAMPQILEDLEKRNFAFKIFDYMHRYPTCWRCKTELVWRVVDEWYIAMDKALKSKVKSQKSKVEENKTYREQMIEVAKKINWIPKWGLDRELDWLSNMHDWLISKKRFWGLALPIWECKECGSFEVIGGREELKVRAFSGWKEFDGNSPHRPWIDQIKIKCKNCRSIMSRIPDVGNPWLDAGIVPFSTLPAGWFPADFITESFPGQFKNWFYSLIAMATAIKNEPPFKTVLGFASVRDEKGEEMHKSKGNAIEFNEAAGKIGGDVMRWLYTTQKPELNLNFGYGPATDVKRRFYLILWNSYKFFVDYAKASSWECGRNVKDLTILDKWILARLTEVVFLVNESLERFDASRASFAIEEFVVKDFSTWYIRRSRDRVSPISDANDRNTCFSVMYGVLVTLSKLLAPFTPFIAEEIFRNLANEESVHLQSYPKGDKSLLNRNLIEDMKKVREVVEAGHAKRKEIGIRVRQPLPKFSIFNFQFSIEEKLIDLIRDELNVKNVIFKMRKGPFSVEFDTEITNDLKNEGEAREIVRRIQQERKIIGTTLNERVNVTLESWPASYSNYIKRNALVGSLKKGDEFSVARQK
ncbi:MAG: isoleucine--tRNA ligase [Candidatus Levybacteria bacterium]|nr:isoleucine--tRNA ligase [Candidatus Levybacteria bacterium]